MEVRVYLSVAVTFVGFAENNVLCSPSSMVFLDFGKIYVLGLKEYVAEL